MFAPRFHRYMALPYPFDKGRSSCSAPIVSKSAGTSRGEHVRTAKDYPMVNAYTVSKGGVVGAAGLLIVWTIVALHRLFQWRASVVS